MAACNTYVRSDSVVSRVIAAETLIVPIRGNVGDLASIYSLNETATMLWEALSMPKPAEELLSLVVDEYDVEPDQAANELNGFLTEMCAAGLVQCIDTRTESALS
jgi:hypothetical protein